MLFPSFEELLNEKYAKVEIAAIYAFHVPCIGAQIEQIVQALLSSSLVIPLVCRGMQPNPTIHSTAHTFPDKHTIDQ